MDGIIAPLINSYGVYGLIIASIILIIKLSPITLMTSHRVERKLYSKEANFLYEKINYCFFIIAISFFIYIIALGVWSLKINYYSAAFKIILMVLLIIYGVLYWIKYFNQKIDKWLPEKLLDRIVDLYILIWSLIIGYLFGTKLIGAIAINGQFNVYRHIAIFITILICTIIVFEFILPPIKYFIRISTKNKELFITLEGEKNRWYLFYPINKDEFLIGDNAIIDECKKIMIIKRGDLINKEIKLD